MVEPSLSGQPTDGGLCRVCQAPLSAGSPRCSRCAAVHGDGFRCPHCRAIADVERLPDGRQRCKACGGPRLLIDDGKVALSGRETQPLHEARRAAVRAGLWRAVGIGLGAFAALGLAAVVLLLALTSPGVMLGTLALAFASIPLLAALGAYRRGTSYGRQREHAWHDAELGAAKDLAEASPHELTGAELSRALGVNEPRAELLLAELSLQDVVQRRVTESGDLAYSVRPRVRVTEPQTETVEAELDEIQPEPARQTKSEGS